MHIAILAILVGLAVAGAGTLPWSLAAAAACSAGALAAAGLPTAPRRALPLLWAGIAVLAWTSLTRLPCPESVAGPQRRAQFDRVRTLQSQTQPLAVRRGHQRQPGATTRRWPVQSSAPRLSLYAMGSLQILALLTGSWSIFWLCAGLSRRRRLHLLRGMVALGAVVAVLGLVGRYALPQGKTLWWCFPVEHGQPIAAFVNRNHFAAFCALLAPAALCLTVLPWLDSRQAGNHHGRRRRTAAAVTAALFPATAFALLAAAVLLSLSRSGVLGLSGALGVMAVLLLKTRPVAATLAVCGAAAALVAVALWPSRAVQQRLDTLRNPLQAPSATYRIRTWGDSLNLWRDYPLAGCGPGAFRTVFPAYATHPTRKTFTHAENEYVQLLAEGGMIGVILGLTLGGAGVWACRQRRRPGTGTRQCLGAAAAAAVAACALHACLDFAVRVPLVAFTAAALVAGAMPDPTRTRETGNSPRAWWRCGRFLPALVLILFLATCWRDRGRIWPASRGSALPRLAPDALLHALRDAPTDWLAWYELGHRACASALDAPAAARYGRPDPEIFAFGADCIRTAASLNPSNYRVWWELAQVEIARSRPAQARTAFARAVALRPYLRPQADALLPDMPTNGP